MTNMQIIMSEVTLRGITEEVDTYAGWQARKMQVQKGNKALFKTKIWKPCYPKDEDGNRADTPTLILVNASFFGRSQVAAAEEVSA